MESCVYILKISRPKVMVFAIGDTMLILFKGLINHLGNVKDDWTHSAAGLGWV